VTTGLQHIVPASLPGQGLPLRNLRPSTVQLNSMRANSLSWKRFSYRGEVNSTTLLFLGVHWIGGTSDLRSLEIVHFIQIGVCRPIHSWAG